MRPRIAMPAIRHQSLDTKHIYSLDGSVAVGDAYIDPVNQTASSPKNGEWRTILIGGMREAGDVFSQNANLSDLVPGYFALDVTQPDNYENVDAAPQAGRPRTLAFPPASTLNSTSNKQMAAAGCKTLAGKPAIFPLELWTFQDQLRSSTTAFFLDEDQNGVRDLGATWSEPVIGQIAVCKSPGPRLRQEGRPHHPLGGDLRRWPRSRQQGQPQDREPGSTWWTSRPATRSTSAS